MDSLAVSPRYKWIALSNTTVAVLYFATGGMIGAAASLMLLMLLPIGIFFTLMIAGLATTLSSALKQGLMQHGVSATVAGHVASLPPFRSDLPHSSATIRSEPCSALVFWRISRPPTARR